MKRFLLLVFALLLMGCAALPGGVAQEPPTVTPALIAAPCAYVEGRKDFPEISSTLIEKLNTAKIPIAAARAEAYGENCIAADGTTVRFAQREIDFYLIVNVTDLKDAAILGAYLEKILSVINELPPDKLGPNPGYVGVTFQLGEQVQNLWFTLPDANAFLQQGLRGADLYQALVKKP